jgi:hypothetical protein
MGTTVNGASGPNQPSPAPAPAPSTPNGHGSTDTTADRLAQAQTPGDQLRDAASPGDVLKNQSTPAQRLADSQDRSELSLTNGVVAAAAGAQQASRIADAQATLPSARAAEGFSAAQGSLGPKAPNLLASAEKLIQNAPAAEQAHVRNVVDHLGTALADGRLISSPRLAEVLNQAANAPAGGTAQGGAWAHLSRAAEVLDHVRMSPGTALAFDPVSPQANANGGQPAGLGNAETAARLPRLDVNNVDADLYYRQDNRSLPQRTVDAVRGSNDLSRQPLVNDSSKSTAAAYASEVRDSMNPNAAGTQVGQQQAWQQRGTAAEPRQLGVSAQRADGFHELMRPGVLEKMGQGVPDPSMRNIRVDGRSYSLKELHDVRDAAQPRVDAGVARAEQAIADRGRTVDTAAKAGITNNNVAAAHGDAAPTQTAAGKPIGANEPRLLPADMPSMRQGGAVGAATAFGVSTVQALADGKLTGAELKDVAAHTASGGALGAVSAKAEQVVTPQIDRMLATRAAGSGSALGTTLASRVAGATVVGAAVSAGVSIYQNRDGLAKGDSKSIGRVTSDTLIGAAAVGAGSVAGAMAAGAVAGSVVPGLGTAVGAVAGLAVGLGITYGAQVTGAGDWVADKVAQGVDGLKNAASSAWSGLKGVFS